MALRKSQNQAYFSDPTKDVRSPPLTNPCLALTESLDQLSQLLWVTRDGE